MKDEFDLPAQARMAYSRFDKDEFDLPAPTRMAYSRFDQDGSRREERRYEIKIEEDIRSTAERFGLVSAAVDCSHKEKHGTNVGLFLPSRREGFSFMADNFIREHVVLMQNFDDPQLFSVFKLHGFKDIIVLLDLTALIIMKNLKDAIVGNFSLIRNKAPADIELQVLRREDERFSNGASSDGISNCEMYNQIMLMYCIDQCIKRNLNLIIKFDTEYKGVLKENKDVQFISEVLGSEIHSKYYSTTVPGFKIPASYLKGKFPHMVTKEPEAAVSASASSSSVSSSVPPPSRSSDNPYRLRATSSTLPRPDAAATDPDGTQSVTMT